MEKADVEGNEQNANGTRMECEREWNANANGTRTRMEREHASIF